MVGVVCPVAWGERGAVAVEVEGGGAGVEGEGAGGVRCCCLGRGEELGVEAYCIA